MENKEKKYAKGDFESYVGHSEVLLGAGKGHLGIINFLRKSGVAQDEVPQLSIEVFAEANRRLYQSQWPLRSIAGGLMLIGILVPVAFYFTGDGIPVVTIVPLFIGMVLRTKVVRPKQLPELPKLGDDGDRVR